MALLLTGNEGGASSVEPIQPTRQRERIWRERVDTGLLTFSLTQDELRGGINLAIYPIEGNGFAAVKFIDLEGQRQNLSSATIHPGESKYEAIEKTYRERDFHLLEQAEQEDKREAKSGADKTSGISNATLRRLQETLSRI